LRGTDAMNDYVQAPATALVATRCALCNRELVDAASVERGIGPTCAERAGVGDAQGVADWSAVAVAVTLAFPEGIPSTWATAVDDARRAANLCTHWIAADTGHARVPHLLAAVSALGFVQLAATLAEHLVPTVRVTVEGDRLAVTLDDGVRLPDDAFRAYVAAVRAVPGRRWDGDRKANVVPTTSRRPLWDALKATLPHGTVVVGALRVAVL
jgi:Family of unknown function (DUF6011)